jgi:hypothetical protein
MVSPKPSVLEKPCLHCGKIMVWEKAMSRFWDDLKYCGNACQRQANREARRTEPAEVEEDDGMPPPVLTQRFNRPRRKVALKKR